MHSWPDPIWLSSSEHFHPKHGPFLLRRFRICYKEFVTENLLTKGVKEAAEGTKQKQDGVSGKVRKKGGTTFASATPAERQQHKEHTNY